MKRITKLCAGAVVGLAAAALAACNVSNDKVSSSPVAAGQDMESEVNIENREEGSRAFDNSLSSETSKTTEPLSVDLKIFGDKVTDDVTPDEEDDDFYQLYYGCPPVESTDSVKEATE